MAEKWIAGAINLDSAVEMENKWIKQAIVSGSIKTIFNFFITYLIPVITPIITLIIGYLSHLPWFWIWLGILATFAFTANGMFMLKQWLDIRRVEHKLNFNAALLARGVNLEDIILGIQVNSSANFPLEFEVINLRTQISDRSPIAEFKKGNSFFIPENGVGWYYDNPIQMKDKASWEASPRIRRSRRRKNTC